MVISQTLTFQNMVNVKCPTSTCIFEDASFEVVHNAFSSRSIDASVIWYNDLICKAAVPRQVYYLA